MSKVLAIIPARYASTRFPGKPLIDINGRSMIERVVRQVKACSLIKQVIVATDDERIFNHVQAFGGQVEMTSNTHLSGTDRCAEVATRHPDFDILLNVQGDEPFIQLTQLEKVIRLLQNGAKIATLKKKITSVADLFNPNLVKLITNVHQEAIYFSRQAIPLQRGIEKEQWITHFDYYKHIGLYGFQRTTLLEITQLKPSKLEQAESLEQLRWLENGYRIQVAETHLATKGIDTPEDLAELLKHLDE